MIQKIIMRGVKSADCIQELTGRDIIIGPNGAGKTTRAQALGIALMGYAPGGGKLPAETMKLAAGDSMAAGIETESFLALREFIRKGAKIEQKITLNPPAGEKTVSAKEQRIEQELGKLPVMLDFNEFLSLSDMKRREFIYALAGADGGAAVDKDAVIKLLHERIAQYYARYYSVPVESNPEYAEVLEGDVAECAEQYEDEAGLQTGLYSMVDYAKSQLSFWRKEREKSIGASQKISEYKNELDETDRNLDKNTKLLDELYASYNEAATILAKAEKGNAFNTERNKKITYLLHEIAAIEATANQGDVTLLRNLIEQYSAELRNVDNSDEIGMAESFIVDKQNYINEMEKAVEKYRDEYQTVKTKKAANASLINKMSNQKGLCPIDSRIECKKDFSGLIYELTLENDGFDAEMKDIYEKGVNARRELESARNGLKNIQDNINRLRSEEITALRENESIRELIREYEADIDKIKNFDTDKARQLATKRGELTAISPGDAREWAMIDIEPLAKRVAELQDEIDVLKVKIAEQTKARNTLINLKASMIDITKADYHAKTWKDIVDVVGPKGLQGELVKDVLAPLREDIQAKLMQMGINKTFFFQTEDSTGKDLFQFGWANTDGKRRNFDALSTGEQLLLLIALMTTIIERLNPPLKVLCIDNAENLDRNNLLRVLNGLTSAGENLDNIIFSGVFGVDPADVQGWRVWELKGGAA